MEPVILYVEDDTPSRRVMNMLLTRLLGYSKVHIFENSTDFETRLKSLPDRPDVIFLDIHMEPLDGFAVLNLIRQDKTYNDTKVIALTASVMHNEVLKLKDAGFSGVIAKPLDVDTFPDTLKRILENEQIWTIR